MKIFKQKLVEISINAETGSPCFRESIGTSPMKISTGGAPTPLESARVMRELPPEALDRFLEESERSCLETQFKQLKINNLDLYQATKPQTAFDGPEGTAPMQARNRRRKFTRLPAKFTKQPNVVCLFKSIDDFKSTDQKTYSR